MSWELVLSPSEALTRKTSLVLSSKPGQIPEIHISEAYCPVNSYFQRETRVLDNGSKLADYWSFSIDSLTMETIDDDGNTQTDDIKTTQLLDETRYGIVSTACLLYVHIIETGFVTFSSMSVQLLSVFQSASSTHTSTYFPDSV